jgi:GNAT superfamily N-acetyltransferase
LIRSIKKSELSELLKLYKHLHHKDEPLPEKLKLLSIWEEITCNPLLHYFVIVHEGKIITPCTLSIIPNLTRGGRPYGLIENVVTHIDYRRQGLATSLLQYSLEIAWKNNCYEVMLLTDSKDSGIYPFYEKAGFLKGIKTGFIAYPSNLN